MDSHEQLLHFQRPSVPTTARHSHGDPGRSQLCQHCFIYDGTQLAGTRPALFSIYRRFIHCVSYSRTRTGVPQQLQRHPPSHTAGPSHHRTDWNFYGPPAHPTGEPKQPAVWPPQQLLISEASQYFQLYTSMLTPCTACAAEFYTGGAQALQQVLHRGQGLYTVQGFISGTVTQAGIQWVPDRPRHARERSRHLAGATNTPNPTPIFYP